MRRRLVCRPLDARAQGRRHGLSGPGAAHRLREEPPDQGFEPLLHPGLLRRPPDVRGDGDDVSFGVGDFAHVRVKKGPKCRGAESVKLDAKACRATFAENIYDHEVYEHAHRLFCSRLEKAGLRGDEAVETELASSNLCGALDFSKVDDVCGRLETRDVLLKKAAHDARCAHRGPGATPRIELSEGLFSRLRGA